MKQTIKYVLVSILFLQGFLFVAQADNYFSIPEISVEPDENAVLKIDLTNSDKVSGFQFQLLLPPGIEVNTNEIALTSRKDDHTLSVKHLGNNRYLFICFSLSNAFLTGNSGTLLNIPVHIPADYTCDANDYSFVFSEVVISDHLGNDVTGTSHGTNINVYNAPVINSEYQILRNLSINTSGNYWKNQWNITSNSAHKLPWYGVTVTDCHVTKVGLKSNGLKGKLPDLSGLSFLTTLDLPGNSLDDLEPTLPVFANIESQTIQKGLLIINPDVEQRFSLPKICTYNKQSKSFTAQETFSVSLDNIVKGTGIQATADGYLVLPAAYFTDLQDNQVLKITQESGAAKGTEVFYTLKPCRQIDEITNMFPNLGTKTGLSVSFSWTPVLNAEKYDLYLWEEGSSVPTTPIASDLRNVSFTYQGALLGYSRMYNWKLIAKNTCEQKESSIESFRVQDPPNITFNLGENIDFGEVKLNLSSQQILTVTGENLSSPMQINKRGADAEAFIISQVAGWNGVAGGNITIFFVPQTPKLLYNAELEFVSGNVTKRMALTGILKDYFTATTSVEKSIYGTGENVIISGHAKKADNSPLVEQTVEVYVIAMGYRKEIKTTTDTNGKFRATYTPIGNEAGSYKIGACFPGEKLTTTDSQFDIPGIKLISNDWISWEVEQDMPKTGTITIMNRSAIPLHNVRIESISGTSNADFSFSTASVLNGLDVVTLNYTVTGTHLTTTGNWEEIKLQAVTNEGITANFSVWFYCKRAKGVLETNPVVINTTMTRGKSRILEFDLYNYGNGETGNINISIPNVDWMELMNNEISSLAVNDTARISLRLTPGENTPLNTPFTGSIAINCEKGNIKTIPFTIEAVSESTGTLVIDVVDEYFYNTIEAPHLTNARVKVTHPYSFEVVAQGYTNENGIFTTTLPEGHYALFIEADKHESYRNNILIEAGKTLSQQKFLSFKAISYSWKVVPTEIEDRYEIELVTKFETNVPMPVVTIDVPANLPELDEGEEYTFIATLTNTGLIAAQGVTINVPEITDYLFTVLTENVDSIPALQSIEIPVLMTRVNSISLRSAIGNTCKFSIGGIYFYYCGNDAKWKNFLSIPMNIGIEFNCGYEPIEEIKRIETVIPTLPMSPSGDGGGGGGGDDDGKCDNCIPIINEESSDECTPCIKVAKNIALIVLEEIIPVDLGCVYSSVIDGFAEGVIDLFIGNFNNLDYVKESLIGMLTSMAECAAQDAIEKGITYVFPVSKIPKLSAKIIRELLKCIKIEVETLRSFNNTLKSSNNYENDDFTQLYHDIQSVMNYYNSISNLIVNIFQEEGWDSENNIDEFWRLFSSLLDENKLISQQNIEILQSNFRGTSVTSEDISSFVIRWNNTMTYWTNGYYTTDDIPPGLDTNFIDLGKLNIDTLDIARNYIVDKGLSVDDLWNNSLKWIEDYVDANRNTVCASVSLQIDQRLTMTREAFLGTLTLYNGHDSDAMHNVSLNLIIKDENGANCNNLFKIETEKDKLINLTEIDGTGSLNAGIEGSATVLFIPTINAAPTESKKYSFGGTLSYLDPFSGTQVTVDLFPVSLEVQPSPYLHLHYFMPRDIFGDDPLTERIEPSIPAELAVMIDNKGYGTAKNLTIESAQPKIIDNQKGLLIDFNIIGSNLNGQERQLGLKDINFGNMQGNSQMVGQWWFKSSLLGHFTSYESHVKHLDSRGNPDLSLVDTVEIHELTRSITAYQNPESTIAFLVNDIPDANDSPDAIYFANATKTAVVSAKGAHTDDIVTELNPVISLAVESSAKGWNYAKMDDPGQGKFRLVSVTREDSQQIPLTNVWQTHCTLPDGGEPVYENKLHFVDTFSVAGLVNYTLVFEKINTNPLEVDTITGTSTIAIDYPLEKVMVHFNKPVYQPTFTWQDMELRVQGGDNLIDSSVTTTMINDSTFYVNFAEKTQNFGYYTFTVHTNEIYDMNNLPGEFGKRVNWIQRVSPIDTIITQTICEGHSFDFNGRILFESGVYQDTIRKSDGLDSIAQLKLTVLPYPEPPLVSITGTHTLASSSDTGNQWYSENGLIEGVTTQSFTPEANGIYYVVVSNGFCESEPSDEYKVDISGQALLSWDWKTGWHWVSMNLTEPVNPITFFNPVKQYFSRLLNQTGELIYDPQYGFVGNIEPLDPRFGYKLQMKGNVTKELSGIVASPANYIITLRKGWNWIGYPALLNLDLPVALSKLNAELGDVIKSQTDFAMFDETSWTGTLTTLKPGEGYMYYSASDKSLEYSSVRVVKVTPELKTTISGYEQPWEFNPHNYPNNMNIVSQLYLDGNLIPENAYTIGAFSGQECRGIGKYVNGRLYITVHGTNIGEPITFKAIENQSQEETKINESVSFDEIILGTLSKPYLLNILTGNTGTDLTIEDNFFIYPNPVYDCLHINGDISKIKKIRISDLTGKTMMMVNDLKSNIQDVSYLSSGMYIVSLYTETRIMNYQLIKAHR